MNDKKSTHPTEVAYEAGAAYGANAARGRYGSVDETARTAKQLAKGYEDADAFMDGYWAAVTDA